MTVGPNGERSSTIEVLTEVATVARRPAKRREGSRELRVAVKDAGGPAGPAVDARWIITGLANFQPGDKVSKYQGPTREGLWLAPGEALELAEALTRAVLAIEALEPSAVAS